jgi:hypothetical protein
MFRETYIIFKQYFKYDTNYRRYYADFANIIYIGLQNNLVNVNKDLREIL